VIGSVNFYKSLLILIANTTGCVVVGIDYRKAPEFKFPAAPNDCLEATEYIIQHAADYEADPTQICVIGDSAGGITIVVLL
jgi:acetyl esterase